MQTVIRTKQWCVVDQQGAERIRLNVTEDARGLLILDENGKTRAGMSVNKNGPGLVMKDKNGKLFNKEL